MSADERTTINRSAGQIIRRSLRDGVIFALSVWVAALIRYDFAVVVPNYSGIWGASIIAFAAFVLLGPLFVYRGRYWRATGDELVAVGALVAIGAGIMYLVSVPPIGVRLVPTSVPMTAAALTIVVIGLTAWADARLKAHRRLKSGRSRRALIIGAAHHGLTAYRMISQDPRAEFVAVGFLDDDPQQRRMRIEGTRVLGSIDDLPTVLGRTEAEVVIIATRSLPAERMDAVVAAAADAGVEIKVLPTFDERELRHRGVSGASAVALRPAAFRSVEIDDLLGRKPISTDVEAIADYLRGKTVLVTGAGGSIGSYICQQLARFDPARVVMTDRDESGLHATQLVLEGSAMLTSEDLVLGDLRDVGFVRGLVDEVRPDIIFHAAALKHLTFLERFPDEAIKTNVGASLSLLDAAVEFGVAQLVHISTDKAADPTSVLGASKYLTERAVASRAAESGLCFMSVRFGNVLGSRGSVLGTFVAQVQAGGPVTITAPGVRRFFMSAAEACELVLQAGAIGNPGETLVLDMGEPVLIEDLAKRVIALSGRDDISIEYTGLREGEKIEEARLAETEVDDRPTHPLISQVPIPGVSLSGVRALVASARISGHRRDDELVAALRRLVDSHGSDTGEHLISRTGESRRTPQTAPLAITSVLDGLAAEDGEPE